MIVQDFHIARYGWKVRVYYAVSTYWADMITNELRDMGCNGIHLERAYHNLTSGSLDTGLTYSDFENRRTLMVISRTSSAAQFQNSLDHEKGHLCMHISHCMGIDPYGEEAQYLSGYVGQKMFSVARHFLCEHCREKLYAKEKNQKCSE